ncbi:thiol reductant ABC exporter subunit CydD [Streptomyces sp. XM4193]|uniref:thiol reductant ABC exporter subunit CydD n=1 Tax=Streptomyces sp. XM4193 TaxID=2929782 RepID=UPI001FFC2907|nr:thiol reductant ABC exporter subunit CydD [Streptomyces sp. XM4193]MCK1794675.1 thiol reductant ABC exporter subunit CydD [Streptomyces sp. XM4193]
MRPVDPRLLRYARATRGFLLASVALGLLTAGLVVAQAMLVAELVVRSFQQGAGAEELAGPLGLLAAVSVGRGVVGWLTGLAAHRSSAAVKSELRLRLLQRAAALGPGAPAARRTGELTALATRGVDALDDYFGRYLPQLGLAVVVPVAVLARIVWSDWIAALTIALTLPLIPVFMVLIGWATQARMDRQWRMLSRLSHHFLDVVAGLPTLKVFGRAKAQAESVRRITGDYRRATMRTLRVAFVSSFALELLATISVALVAVGIGTRLVHGQLDLYSGLVVLILAPEAYLPLRQVGTHYHAAAEGLAAAEQVFEVLAEPLPQDGGRRVAGDGPYALAVQGLTVRRPGRSEPAVHDASFAVAPGETVALTGPSGAGKSTVLSAVLGFVNPSEGRVLVGGADPGTSPGPERPEVAVPEVTGPESVDGVEWTPLAALSRESWHRRVAWVPQHPTLFAGTVADNVRLARPDADEEQVRAALRDAAAPELSPDRTVGEGGTGLSAGQRQRVALARAFLADRPVLLLDEPTAALDGETEASVVAAVRRLAVGRTVLLVVHRPALLEVADRVVELPGPTRRPAPGDTVPPEAGARTEAVRAAAVRETAVAETPAAEGAGAATKTSAAFEQDGGGAVAPRLPEPALRRVRAGWHGQRGRFVLAGVLGALALGSAVALMATSGWLISRASEQPPILYLLVAVTLTRAFGIGRAVFRYAERLVSHDAVLRVLADLRVGVHRRLEQLSPAGLRESRRGDLLARLVSDVDDFQDYFLRWLLPAWVAAGVSLAAVGFTAWLLPAAGAVLAAGLLVAGVAVPLLTVLVARRTESQLAPARGELHVRIVDLLSGVGELTVAGALGDRLAAVRGSDTELTRLARRSAAGTALAGGLILLTAGLTVTVAALVGVAAVADGRLAGVWLAVVVLTPLAAFEAVLDLPQAVQHRQRVRRSAQRVYEVLDTPVPVAEPDRPEPAPRTPFPVEVRGLSVRHPGAARLALEDVELRLEAGRRVAVVGRSGAGKTTLAQAMLRFVEPAAGRVLLGGRDTRRLDSDEVRRRIGLCAQDAHLFDSTLRENLRLARPDADEAALRSALAGARLLEWVDGLPDGLDTEVGEHGARLSGGQRQRLALARALLADFPVLLLDEPAEHLDLATADALAADLLAVTEGRTTLLITHRLRGLDAVDEIVVLESGRVAERGTYAELLARRGAFAAMLARERAQDALLTATGRPLAEKPLADRPDGDRPGGADADRAVAAEHA